MLHVAQLSQLVRVRTGVREVVELQHLSAQRSSSTLTSRVGSAEAGRRELPRVRGGW